MPFIFTSEKYKGIFRFMVGEKSDLFYVNERVSTF